jgi:DNA-directed RNA polymerase subunit K/omega
MGRKSRTTKIDKEAKEALESLEAWGMHLADKSLLPQYDLVKPERDNKPAIRAARVLYLKEYTYEQIFLLTHLPPRVFAKLEPKWIELRNRIDEAVITEIRAKAIAGKAEEFVHKGLTIGLKFLDRALKQESYLTPKDFKLVMDSVMAIHRVKQLEDGKPTDISVYDGMDPHKMGEYLIEVARQLKDKHGEIYDIPSELDIPKEDLLLTLANDTKRPPDDEVM